MYSFLSGVLQGLGVLGLFGLGVGLFHLVRHANAARRTTDWRRIEGRIVWSQVEEEKRPGEEGGMTTGFVADIRYLYAIGAVERQGQRVHINDQWQESDDFAREPVHRY